MYAACIAAYLALSVLITQPFRYARLKYYQARFISLVTLSFISYILAHFMPFSTAFYATLAPLCAAGVLCLRKPFFDRKVESVFIAAFAYFLFLRFLLPDVIGAEKLMDMAFMNAVLKAERFPPFDPFFAGGVIDCYYYFGYVIGAATTLMSFSPPEVGFNIAIASVAAHSCMLVYGFLSSVLRNARGGLNAGDRVRVERTALFSVVFVLFSGNLYAVYELASDIAAMKLPGFLYYWNATRVIEGTINEFPYFSFIHADFHAHVVAIPVKILMISLLYEFYRGKNVEPWIVLLSAVIYITNSWDSPIMLLLIACVAAVRRREGIVLFAACCIVTFLASTTIHSASAKPLLVEERSDLGEFLLFFSIQLAFAYYYLRSEFRAMLMALPVALLSSIIVPIALPVIPLLAASLRRSIKRKEFFAFLIFAACLIILIPEFVAIESRLNTVFKFYLAAWLMLTLPGAIALSDVFRSLSLGGSGGLRSILREKNALAIFMLVLFAMSLAYPTIATPVRHYKAEMTLDGMAFTRAYGEYEAIKWLREKRGVIAEAASKCYTYGGRFAAFTGNPTIVGWACHEVQWRGNGEELAKRMADLRAIYTTHDVGTLKKLLKKYNVSYVVVGHQERKEYGAKPEQFDGILKKVYEDRGVVIFAFE
ncbi:DUF2298 domain-containing protein [Archaeoglobus veneficus]|uniref:YYY membrane protein n=1 Tax=Archaeoglobus veneficus (strain DSM 11195 / SNP6) TaxID=693661 RepID=F2KQY9_ARCVS|nr:DUF2298 domain-containing protein [Archaeoglobus veneficus]AEA47795.1 YYY membrane protein [Archaeoglobus veneficus SNP6]